MGRGRARALSLLDARLPILGSSRRARVREIAERQSHLALGLRLLQGAITVDAGDLPEDQRQRALAEFQRDCELGQVAVAHVVSDVAELVGLAGGG